VLRANVKNRHLSFVHIQCVCGVYGVNVSCKRWNDYAACATYKYQASENETGVVAFIQKE
jgi:hypothetical protein